MVLEMWWKCLGVALLLSMIGLTEARSQGTYFSDDVMNAPASTVPFPSTSRIPVIQPSAGKNKMYSWVPSASGLGLGTANSPTFAGLTLNAPSGSNIAYFLYGASGTPLPTDPSFGFTPIQFTVYGNAGTNITDAFTNPLRVDSHLSAGTRGIALGGLFRGYTDGTWGRGGSLNAGSIGIWAEGHTSRGGVVFGEEIVAQADTTTVASSLQGIEIDTNASVSVGSKFGIAINSDNTDTGAITGTQTVAVSSATVANGAAVMVQGLGGTYPYGLLTIQSTANGTPPFPTTGSLWRAGGFSVVNGLDWGDMTFSGSSLSLPGFTLSGAGAAVSTATNGYTVNSNNAAVVINGLNGTSSLLMENNSGSASQYLIFSGNSYLDYAGVLDFRAGISGPVRAALDASGNFNANTLAVLDTSAAFNVNLAGTSSTTLTAGRTLTLDMKNVAHTLAFNATANTITFPNTASYTLIGSGDTGTVTSTMLANNFSLTGVPTAPTAPLGTNTTQLATTAFVLANSSLSGTTGSIGGSALLAGACTSGTVSVTGATTGMVAIASPVTYPGDGFDWASYVSVAGTVTVKVCGFIAGTPTASAYNVRVIQ
jgi:hypothetical protein